jgi:hypothetical protein
VVKPLVQVRRRRRCSVLSVIPISGFKADPLSGVLPDQTSITNEIKRMQKKKKLVNLPGPFSSPLGPKRGVTASTLHIESSLGPRKKDERGFYYNVFLAHRF